MLYDYSKNNIFDGLLEYVNHEDLLIFLVHNFTPDIVNQLNSIDGKIIVLFYIGDYFLYKELDEILSNNRFSKKSHRKLKNYFIILSVHNIDESLKKEYANSFTFVYNPLFYVYYTGIFKTSLTDLLSNKKLHFLSFNGRADASRQSLFYFFNKFSLLDKSYFSYLGDMSLSSLSDAKSLNDITLSLIENGVPWYLKGLDYNEINKQIPLKIPNHTYDNKSHAYNTGEPFLYNDTFCSIITETYYKENHPYFTEKTFRSIAQSHPFILYSNHQGLKVLQNLGFKTFGDFWDETYDNLRDNQRLEAIMHLILEIGNWNIDKLNNIHKRMIPVLEHNRNHFFNTLPQMYKEYTPSLYSQIKHIVESAPL
jgi:hypothetical protein